MQQDLALDGGGLAPALDARLRDASPQAVLETALGLLGDRVALVSSFGAESAVLLHMAAEVDPHVAVLFLDTGMLFGQTLDYRQTLAAELGLTNVRDLRPAYQDLAVQDPAQGLWKTDANACCAVRKVAPLDLALADFDGWITGRKRFQGGRRLQLKVVEQSDSKLKFNPLAGWSKMQIDDYATRHALPAHPLVEFGYPSIGCWPCTKPAETDDLRAGRWAGSAKTECGIHLARAQADYGVGGDI